MAVWVHFFHRYVQGTIIILEEGNPPHPRYPQYNILVTWCTLNRRNLVTAQRAKGEERKRRRLSEE